MNFIRNIDRKYVVMGGSVIGIILVLLISMLLLSSCSSKTSYSKIENKMVNAATKYIDEKGKPEVNQKKIITTKELIDAKYMKDMSKYTSDTCEGTVTVYNNGEVINYLPYLTCTNYKTNTLKDQIINDSLTTEKSGLYALNGEYIFKGNTVNNYIKLGSTMFRIMSIDSDSNLRLLAIDSSKQSISWDNKFNENTNDLTGENVYEESYIYNYLNGDYKASSEKYRKKIIPHDICVGFRSKDNLTISKAIDCNITLKDQYVGLINASDYALASLDKDCKDIKNSNCQNYNYLYGTLRNTWTLNSISENSSEVIGYFPGTLRRNDAIINLPYNLVIYVSGNELYKKGDGTYNNPYIVE